MLIQDVLRAELTRRVGQAAAGLGAPVPTHPILDLHELTTSEEDGVAAIAVLRGFEPSAFARSALAFAAGLDHEERDTWFRAFTRTLFLSGNPANLAARFPFRHVADDGSVAWYAPSPPAHTVGLRRLLKVFTSTAELAPPTEFTVAVPGAAATGRTFDLHVGTAGLTVPDYLVHVNHILAEAVLTHTVEPGDRLVLRHVPQLGEELRRYRRLRVHLDRHDRTRLRAYACLSEPEGDAR